MRCKPQERASVKPRYSSCELAIIEVSTAHAVMTGVRFGKRSWFKRCRRNDLGTNRGADSMKCEAAGSASGKGAPR